MKEEIKISNNEVNIPEKNMKLELIDFDQEFKKDMDNDIGFIISNPQSIIPRENKKTIDGIFSPLFGTEITDELEYVNRYSCECKELRGKFYEGMVCKKCGTKVEFRNKDIEKTGWMELEDFHLINPIMFQFLSKVIGKKNLNNIIKYNKKIDGNGNIVIDMDEYDPNNPFFNIGMIEFYEKFDEILNYYKKNIKEEKMKYYNFIMDHRDIIFIQHIPVFSLILRPIFLKNKTLNFADINKKYATLISYISALNKKDTILDRKLVKTLPLLYNAQININEIHLDIIKQVVGKDGQIRSNILGFRTNFSSRCVIVPLMGKYAINEVILPYICFLELYKPEIINLLCKIDKITLNQADERWHKAAQKFDNRIYLLMKFIISHTKGGLKIIINRNPTLNYGSLLIMNVVDVHPDYENFTMSLPVGVLSLLGADFDGDVINIISIKERSMAEIYENIFNPEYMFIDNNDGKFNRRLGLIKDQTIGLYSFCND